MADNAAFGGPKEKGPPKWLMIGGAIAGVAGLAVLVMRNTSSSGGGSTVSAGTSINAALGSLQEEQMNLLGTVQTSAAANAANFGAAASQATANYQGTLGAMADNTNSILQAISDQGTSVQSQIQGAVNSINANTNSNNQGLMAQLTQAYNDLAGNEANILSYVQATNANVSAVGSAVGGVSSQVSQVDANMANNANQFQSEVVQELANLQNLQQEVVSGNNTAATTQQFTQNIGSFLGWEFYQIPNRYAAFIPGTAGYQNVATGQS